MKGEKKKTPKSENQALIELVESLKINKKYLAELTGMNAYTFKMKLSAKNVHYRFTEEEIQKVKDALCEISGQLSTHCSKG